MARRRRYVDFAFLIQQGVTSTNVIMDVVQFILEHVFQDLHDVAYTLQPNLQRDAICFLYSFHNQVLRPTLSQQRGLLTSRRAHEGPVHAAPVRPISAIGEQRLLQLRGTSMECFSFNMTPPSVSLREHLAPSFHILNSIVIHAG